VQEILKKELHAYSIVKLGYNGVPAVAWRSCAREK